MVNKEDGLLLDIQNLRVSFPLDEGVVQAVDGIDFSVGPGEVHAIVGESGSGKSVTAHAIMRIIARPGRIDAGQIMFYPRKRVSEPQPVDMIDLAKLSPSGREICRIRGKHIAMVFQEPMSSFSPVHTIGNQIAEAIRLHQGLGKSEARKMAIEALSNTGIPDAATRIDDYAFQFSGGMRQRAMIAMAMSCNPSLLIADEPTTALDVTIQAQILALMKHLQAEANMAIMFISHNLGVVAHIADWISIMYLGRIVESGSVGEIFHNPKHPYTVNLLRAIPTIGKTSGKRLNAIEGRLPGPFERPRGCAFHPRCNQMTDGRCDTDAPRCVQLGDGHSVACWLCY